MRTVSRRRYSDWIRLVLDGTIIACGHNQGVQKGCVVLHAEMDCLENAGPWKAADHRRSILYSTLSRCDMCSGTVLFYGISKDVIGENKTFKGPLGHLTARVVELVINDSQECKDLMERCIRKKPELWNEDIGK